MGLAKIMGKQLNKNTMNQYSLENYQRPQLTTPNGEDKILLHSCCAPCAGEIMEALVASKIQPTLFFYNPNKHLTQNTSYIEDLFKSFGKDFLFF